MKKSRNKEIGELFEAGGFDATQRRAWPGLASAWLAGWAAGGRCARMHAAALGRPTTRPRVRPRRRTGHPPRGHAALRPLAHGARLCAGHHQGGAGGIVGCFIDVSSELTGSRLCAGHRRGGCWLRHRGGCRLGRAAACALRARAQTGRRPAGRSAAGALAAATPPAAPPRPAPRRPAGAVLHRHAGLGRQPAGAHCDHQGHAAVQPAEGRLHRPG